MDGTFSHIPVLFNETINALNIKPDGVYVDCTAGGGGHSAGILSHLSENGRLIAIDRDPDAVAVLNGRFAGDRRVTVVKSNYTAIRDVLSNLSLGSADGILADLGVSSYQLDTPERGFSFHNDAPLDMRMSREGISAYDVVNTYSEERLTDILFRYGEEKFARSIAHKIVLQREEKPVETTLELSDIIAGSVPMKVRREGHPARKSFQAIRIEVNGELTGLENAVTDMFAMLSLGGTLAIITFHSLEDRIVKEYFKSLTEGCICPKEFPVCICGRTPRAKAGKSITASAKELEENPRSRSAKLRTAVKLKTEDE